MSGGWQHGRPWTSSSSGAVRGGAVRGGARPAPDPQWGDYLPGQASAPLATWQLVGAPGTGCARCRRPYKRKQQYRIPARKAFLRKYDEHLQSGGDGNSFDAVHVAMDVLSYDAYMKQHNKLHPDTASATRSGRTGLRDGDHMVGEQALCHEVAVQLAPPLPPQHQRFCGRGRR